jgi:hypothetical protein
MGEVRDAAKVNAAGGRSVPTAMKMIAVGGYIILKNAVPEARHAAVVG